MENSPEKQKTKIVRSEGREGRWILKRYGSNGLISSLEPP